MDNRVSLIPDFFLLSDLRLLSVISVVNDNQVYVAHVEMMRGGLI